MFHIIVVHTEFLKQIEKKGENLPQLEGIRFEGWEGKQWKDRWSS